MSKMRLRSYRMAGMFTSGSAPGFYTSARSDISGSRSLNLRMPFRFSLILGRLKPGRWPS
jgi:hypothetical protein